MTGAAEGGEPSRVEFLVDAVAEGTRLTVIETTGRRRRFRAASSEIGPSAAAWTARLGLAAAHAGAPCPRLTPASAPSSAPSPTPPAATWSPRSPRTRARPRPASPPALPISRQAVAKHLKLLGEAGLVSSHRHGREALFELDAAPLAEAAAWIGAVGAEWDGRLGRLRRLLEA